MRERKTKSLPQFATDSEAALESYKTLGYHVEEDIWSPIEREALIRAAKNFSSFKQGISAPLMQPHREDSLFLLALRNPKIVRIVEKLVGGRVSGLQSEFFFSGPGTPGFAKHQDNRSVEAKADAFVSAWSAMVDINPMMGGLIGYPGTHNEAILPTRKTGRPASPDQDPNAYGEEAILPESYEPLDLAVRSGSVVFMHSHFVHASNQNNSSGFRFALLLTYIRCGESFRAGFNAKRAEVAVY
jgi:phytanoyl-CoA hydroxylase